MPAKDTLERLRAVWSEILNAPDVGDDDHFIELGGDSIAAVMCVSHILAEFNVEIPASMMLLEHMTLSSLARAIESTLEAESTLNETAGRVTLPLDPTHPRL